MFKINDEPESPDERAWLRSMINRNRQMRGTLKMYDELESTNYLACLRYMLMFNSNNNTIYLECLLSTCVCVCVQVMQSQVSRLSFLSFRTNHADSRMRRAPPQACIKTPSTILHG